MFSMKLLLTFSLLTGLVAEECTADLGIDDFSSTVTITNTGGTDGGTVATVNVRFDHGRVSMTIPPGKSRTAVGIASTKYTVMVAPPRPSSGQPYRESLLKLRDRLFDISASRYMTQSMLVPLFTELSEVQGALEQLSLSGEYQACTGTVEGASNTVTLKWNNTLDKGGLWVLDCG